MSTSAARKSRRAQRLDPSALENKFREVDRNLKALEQVLVKHDSSVGVLLHNQRELLTSSDYHDIQFCVSMRLFVVGINSMLERAGAPNFDVFRMRKDYKNHLEKWIMGESMSDLGPELDTENQGKENSAPREVPEGAVIFGGDYAANQDGNERISSDGQPDTSEVPTVPATDPNISQPENG